MDLTELLLERISKLIHEKVHTLELPFRIKANCPIVFTNKWLRALLCIHLLEQKLKFECFHKAGEKRNEVNENISEEELLEIEKVIIEFIDIDVTLQLLQLIKSVNDGDFLEEIMKKFELKDDKHSYVTIASNAKEKLSELILTL